ncbi:hypothetical protein ABT340_38745 [Streptosporangium sp. NPDC000239]|uniref:hypothetical protein n=1 Tax=Streptosporangium sp. NPDC000239 TaxID=3154248 RepID=UPI00332116C5
MAPEQPSQPHLPPAWPEAAETTSGWANDSFGASSPRLPLPHEEPASPADGQGQPGAGWEQAGASTPEYGWSQPTPSQTPNGAPSGSSNGSATLGGGWDQALASPSGGAPDDMETPRQGVPTQPPVTGPASGWNSPAGTGWDQAARTAPADPRDRPASSATTSWSDAFTPQPKDALRPDPDLAGGYGGQLPEAAPVSAEPRWDPQPPAEATPADNPVWPPATAENTGWPSATTPQDDAAQPPATANASWPSAAPQDNAVWPPTAQANGSAWPSASAENTGWPPAAPASGPAAGPTAPAGDPAPGATAWPSAVPGDNPVWPPSAAEGTVRDPLSHTWSTPPQEEPSRDGAPFGEDAARGSFGVPNNPAVWALAATTAPEPTPRADPLNDPLNAPRNAPPVDPLSGPPNNPLNDPLNDPLTAPAYDASATRHPADLPLPPQAQPFGQPGQPAYPGQPGQHEFGHPGQPGQPGHHLSQDPSDPNRRFVTAGQISGPKTPPPERQQELWDTVFGDNYQAMGNEDDFDEQGRPVWVFALVGSVVIALVGALLWAFMAGPLAATNEADPAPSAKPSATSKKPPKSQTLGRLPRFPGKASPVSGTLADQAAAISVTRLGGEWREDQRRTVPTVYGFTTRQYVAAGTDSAGRTQFAQLMSGVLPSRLKDKYTSPENLSPVTNAVAASARKKFFPEDNTARKTAQQSLTVNGLPGQLSAYEITTGDTKTTMVVAAVSTGADLPSIVYMSVPDSKKELLPDINTVFTSIKALSS